MARQFQCCGSRQKLHYEPETTSCLLEAFFKGPVLISTKLFWFASRSVAPYLRISLEDDLELTIQLVVTSPPCPTDTPPFRCEPSLLSLARRGGKTHSNPKRGCRSGIQLYLVRLLSANGSDGQRRVRFCTKATMLRQCNDGYADSYGCAHSQQQPTRAGVA